MTQIQSIDFDLNKLDGIKSTVAKRGLTYKIITYGCSMNEHDSEHISGILENMGFVKREENPDMILFNTCCVRDNAEHKLFGNVGALKEKKEQNSDMIIGVCGCMMQQVEYADNLKKRFPFVDIIFGTHNMQELPAMMEKVLNKEKVVSVFDTDGYIIEGMPVKRVDKTSAFINIMYGCNNFCTYCIVPYVRGRERSRNSSHIIEEAKQLADSGVSQITLLGQNVNSYNKGSEDLTFPELLSALSSISGLKRINYLTSHPKDLSDELIEVIGSRDNISKHLHLPVQAGDNSVLKSMNRGYTREDYLGLIDKIKNKIPAIGITTDIIVGFPGETDAQFGNTLDLIKQVKYDGVFSFMYNIRKGTKAETMDNQVQEQIKKQRLNRLIDVQNTINIERNKGLIGHQYEVLIDKKSKREGQMCGRTMCGKLINVECPESSLGKYLDVVITGAHSNSLSAKVVNK